MSTIRPHEYDPDSWEDQEEPAHFERVRKQSEKSPTIKGDRRQQEKEWGRAINKYHKQRAREGGGKP